MIHNINLSIYNMKKVLVTGGSGFIGSAICKMLTKKGISVTSFDNNFRQNIKKKNYPLNI